MLQAHILDPGCKTDLALQAECVAWGWSTGQSKPMDPQTPSAGSCTCSTCPGKFKTCTAHSAPTQLGQDTTVCGTCPGPHGRMGAGCVWHGPWTSSNECCVQCMSQAMCMGSIQHVACEACQTQGQHPDDVARWAISLTYLP